ncbi:hypothetical protein F5B20DRAFT_558890 [Whalleya microplaca]|nr:hypothetical protein F5B20DRAFT_558890 [Whalleya microplaca]
MDSDYSLNSEPILEQTVDQAEPNTISSLEYHQKPDKDRQLLPKGIIFGLNYFDWETEYHLHLFKRHPETLQWFTGSSIYKKWLNTSGQTLFCPGRPDSGKSVIASVVIEDLFNKFHSQHDNKIGIAYLYGYSPDDKRQTVAHLLVCLLNQLKRADNVPRPRIILNDFYDRHKNTPKESFLLPLSELWNVFQLVIACYSRVFIAIDALDEIPYDHCKDLVSEILELQKGADISVFATSNPRPDLQQIFKNSLQIPIETNALDLETYFKAKLKDMPASIRDNPNLQQVIHREAIEDNTGTFFAAASCLESYTLDYTSEYDWMRRQRSLKYYAERTMKRIVAQEADPKRLAMKVLSWLTCAKRTLKVRELQHAIAVETYCREPKDNELFEVDRMLSICMGLLEVDEESNVQFAHIYIEEYLEKTGHHWFPEAENSLAASCVEYVSMQTFNSGPVETDELFEKRLQQWPFYDYSARYWGHHYKKYSGVYKPCFPFSSDHALQASVQVFSVTDTSQLGYSQRFPRNVTEVHIAAYFGLTERIYLNWADHRDSDGRTPLWWALSADQKSVVRKLCDADTVTLHLLVEAQEQELVRTLLVNQSDAREPYNTNIQDFQKRTPLHRATWLKNLDIARDLVRYGANVDSKDLNGVTPLQLAFRTKQAEMICLLITHSTETRDIPRHVWLDVFKKPSSAVIGLFKDGIDPARFIDDYDAKDSRFATSYPSTGRYILQFPPSISTPVGSKKVPIKLDHFSDSKDGGIRWNYRITARIPIEWPHECISQETLEIAWHVILDDRTHSWRYIKNFTNLEHLWIPSHGIDFYQTFIVTLGERWLKLCEFKERRLQLSRQRLLRQKGNDPSLLDTLLEGGDEWIDLKNAVQDTVAAAKRFGQQYAYRHDETEALPGLIQVVDNLQKNINAKLNQLDETSRNLIQLEFNLVSINEARRSTTTSASMSRLSWITFIFLPLTFISGLFGMNVDILASNPPWWLYLPFAIGTFLLAFTIWVIFKRDQDVFTAFHSQFFTDCPLTPSSYKRRLRAKWRGF